MKRKVIFEIVVSLLVILWVYAAVSKLLDYETFKVQLGKSPLLTQFAGLVAVVVPLAELLIAVALVSKRRRLLGLYASFFMLATFTSYLIAILKFSYYIPCSCGGILSGMSWNTHILFNLVFAALAIVGIMLTNRDNSIYRSGFIPPNKLA